MSTERKITGFIILCMVFLSVSVAKAEMPGPDPAALWKYITQTSPYTQWKFWKDHRGMLKGRQPHGSFHKVYVNDRAFTSSSVPLQYGSIEVKENYNRAKKLMAITVMYKVKGYNPENGDWFWVKYSPDGMAKPYGKPRGCLGCHGAKADNDFVIVHDFK